MIPILSLGLLLSLGSPDPTPSNPPPAETTAEEKTTAASKPAPTDKVDIYADTPPPIKPAAEELGAEAKNEPPRSLLAQVGRAILGLAIVVALIYLVAKVGLTRLTGLRSGLSGKHVQVIERVQLDAKNAVYVVDVPGNKRMLLGSGDAGLNFLCELDQTPGDKDISTKRFDTTLRQTEEQSQETKT